jgi:hypothetical protein
MIWIDNDHKKSKLTEFGAEAGKTSNRKVVHNFDMFPESINTPSCNQQFRSYDLCKLRVLLKFQFWTE